MKFLEAGTAALCLLGCSRAFDAQRASDSGLAGDVSSPSHDATSAASRDARTPSLDASPGATGGDARVVRVPDASTSSGRGAESGAPLDARACTPGVPPPAVRAPPAPVGARHIGTLEHPEKVLFRDGAATGLLKGQLTWLFHVTHFTGDAEDGAKFRTATAAFGDTANPLAVTEPVDKQGIPLPLLSLTPDETKTDPSDGGGSTTFVWPNVMVDNGFEALLYYAKAKVSSGTLDVEYSGVGVARLKEGSTVAVRDSRLLFDASEPGFSLGGVVTGGYLYLYGCTSSADHSCRIARVPRGGFTDRSRFTFWDGCQWTPDVSKSSAIMDDMPAEMTVSYNAFLNKYLAVYTGTAPNEAFMRTAARPEGPWSEPVLAFRQFPHKILLYNYGAKEHPELSREGGRVIYVSYPQQLDAESNVIQLVELTLG